MVKVIVKMEAKGWMKSGSVEMELEADTIEDMEKLLSIAKEDFKLDMEM